MAKPPLDQTWIGRRLEDICAAILASMAIAFLIQIIWRYVFNQPQGWTVEYVAIAWLWGILFGYAFIVRDADIIRLDIVYGLLSPKAKALADAVSGLIIAGVLIWSVPATYEYITFMRIERTAFMQVSFDMVFAIYMPFLLSVIVRTLRSTWSAVCTLRHSTTESAA